ncbi:restriction endonuclease [Streptodolium elevatio]
MSNTHHVQGGSAGWRRARRTRRSGQASHTRQARQARRARGSSLPSPRLARLYGQLTVAFLIAASAATYFRAWRVLAGVAAITGAVVVLAVGVSSIRRTVRRGLLSDPALDPALDPELDPAVDPILEAAPEPAVVPPSLTDVDLMDGPEFERHVGALCLRDGCIEVRIDGGAGDLGADVTAHLPDGRLLVVQCKRYAADRGVGSPDMQRFVGTARPVHGADVALFAASTRFTEPALELALSQGIVVVDRDLLAQWMDGTPLTAIIDGAEADFAAEGWVPA